jgi:hypothetical protein
MLLGQLSLLACLTLADEGTMIHQKCQEPLSQQQSITYPEDTNLRHSYLATKFLSSVLSEHMTEHIYTQQWVTQNII